MSGAPPRSPELSVMPRDDHPSSCLRAQARHTTRPGRRSYPLSPHRPPHASRSSAARARQLETRALPADRDGRAPLEHIPATRQGGTGVSSRIYGARRPRAGAASTRLTRANRSRHGIPRTPLGATRTAVRGCPTPSHHGLDRSQIGACDRYAHTSREKNNVPLYSANLHSA